MKRLLPLALLLAAACGTTVPVTTSVNGQPQLDGSTTGGVGGSTGTQVGDGSTGATAVGTSGSTGGQVVGTSGTGSAGSTGTSTGSGTTGGSTGAVSPIPSGPRVRTPLKVGVLTVDLGAALKALGSSSSSDKGPDDGYRAVFRQMNLTGGMSGRKLEATYQVIDASNTNWQQDAARSCEAFGDAKVEVVLTEAASTDYGVAACLAKKGIPLISAAQSDKTGHASAPWLFNPFNPSVDRGYGAVVDLLAGSGYVTAKSKTGLVRISCPMMDQAYKNTVLPRFKAAGLMTPLEYTVPCARGFQDAGTYSTAMQNAVLRFRAAGVDRVFVMGSQENLLLQYFAIQAQNQDYHPGYALSSQSTAFILIGSNTFPQEQLPQVHGVGWHPLGDTGVDVKLSAEKRCVALASPGGYKAAVPAEFFRLYANCANTFLLEEVVKRGTGKVTGPVLRSVITGLGTGFATPGVIDGRTLFGTARADGPQSAREFSYKGSCNCMTYLSAPRLMR